MKNLNQIIDDIHNNHKSENDLQTLSLDNEDFQLLLDSIAEGVVVADKKGDFKFFNSFAEQILGIGSKEITPAEWTKIYGCFFPDQITPYPVEQLPLARAINGEEVTNELMFIKNPERKEGVYIEISARPIKDSSGLITGGSIVFRDTTENIKSAVKLNESEKRGSAQFKGFPIPTYIWKFRDNHFVLIDYNNAAEEFTYGKIEEFLGFTLCKMYKNTPNYHKINSDMTQCFNEKRTIKRNMTYSFLSTGEKKELSVTYVFISPDLIMVHTEDITESKKTQEKSKKLSNAVEQTADCVVITNEKSIIEYVNPAFEKTTGYSFAEVVGLTPRIIQSGKHDEAFYKNLWTTIKSGKPFKGTIINKKKNGELFWAEQTITPMQDEDGNITNFVSVMKDITELIKKREHEFLLGLVQELQKRLYKTTITVPGFDIVGATYPVDKTNGDYFDFLLLPDGTVGFVVGDVCGHGICAALIMAETRAYLRAFSRIESDPGKVLNMLNQELASDLDDFHYVTLIFARLDPKNKLLDYASAGHVPAYVINSAGKVESKMESTGIPLGFMHDYKYTASKPIQLSPESTLVFLTDGITETQSSDEQEFGENRAIEIIKSHPESSAQQIVEKLYQEVLSFSNNNQEDDITSIICKSTRA